MPFLHDEIMDAALVELDDGTHIYICSQEPTTRTEAVTTYGLGNKNFGAGGVFGAPVNGASSGRRAQSTAVTDGSVTANGTASHWAVVDGTRLLAAGPLASSQAVTNGNTFTLTSFDVTIPDPS